MAKKHLPDAEVLRKLLRYDPQSGKLYWRERGPEWFTATRFSQETRAKQGNGVFAGKEAFTSLNDKGYRMSSLLGHAQASHIVIWTMVHGSPPVGDIDHINGIPDDNRIENLRDVPRHINCRNTRLHKNNTSGHSGVWRIRKTGQWMAVLYVSGGRKYLGRFKKKEDAVAARKAAEAEWGFTARHGT